MTYRRGSILGIVTLMALFLYSNSYGNDVSIPSDNKVIVRLDYIPDGVKPGDKPITLTKSLLRQLLPELTNPRLMSIKDLNDPDEREGFFEGGYGFVLRGDFNGDGFADIAFTGRTCSIGDSKCGSFVVIISIKGKNVIRDYFTQSSNSKAFLIRSANYRQNTDAVGLIYNLFSEECGYVYWSVDRYAFMPCKSTF